MIWLNELIALWAAGTFLCLVIFRLDPVLVKRTRKAFLGLINPYYHWDILTWAKYFGLSLIWPVYFLGVIVAIPFVLVNLVTQTIAWVISWIQEKKK